MINANTKLFCIIGNPVDHSLSPQMHNAGFKALGLNYAFVAFQVVNIKQAISGLRGLGIKGAAITIPYKIMVMRYVDGVDDTAKKIGAANTIINNCGSLLATNTDWIGAIEALEEKINITGKIVSLLGAGGAARAIAYGLKQKKAKKIYVFNRTLSRAQELVNEFKLTNAYCLKAEGRIPKQNREKIAGILRNSDIIVNATPVGMKTKDGNESPISEEYLNHNQVIFDIVYTPKETKLIKLARSIGAEVVYGYKMILYQGIKQFVLFTGKKPPVAVMEKALLRALTK